MRNTKLIGIINVTPDSFSDGGKCFSPDAALKAIEQHMRDGADVIDIGAESTRPGALPITSDEEWRRLQSVLAALPRDSVVQFSVDTRHAETARRALDAGAHWINDVSGFSDPAMVAAVKGSNCMLVAMHSLSVPADKAVVMSHGDVVPTLIAFGRERIATLKAAGIKQERIIFDPGIGFGKTAAQSLAILCGIDRFRELDVKLLVGHSRKSFLASFIDTHGRHEDATLTVSQYLAQQGVDYLRVHDVARHRQMLKLLEALA